MLELDGEVVSVGDSVYDIANGYGKVTDIRDRYTTVLFLNRRRITFKDNGRLNGVRRLFWHDPLIIAPPKNAARWQHLIKIVVGVRGMLEIGPKT